MLNEPTLEELAALELPSVTDVTRRAYKCRQVYTHFFSDEDEFFAAGFDPERGMFVGYSISRHEDGAMYGAWMKTPFDELRTEVTTSGAEFVWNVGCNCLPL